ncbi:response regulator transcription factor [Brachybacterium huguangmaarense]|uniref:Response regulator transcription factor n=1 Tax=Brachybacterium huguangmaarense TaxID=1652028 RepID=A0ABY6FZ56_9MICO|nr:response regulator transcription factor [Brachybacterium huguangmaarense]UYG16229.1 response regulator transcription factor [Brachybacterium huguangmaarense]
MPYDVAVIDDHPFMEQVVGSAVAKLPDARFVGIAPTVTDFLGTIGRADVVVLDLRLEDKSLPADNVRRLATLGIAALAYTAGESKYLLRLAAQSGVRGVVRKSAPEQVLIDALEEVVAGRALMTPELAAAIDTDPDVANARLSPRERQVLALYADGCTTEFVATTLELSANTVDKYVKDIRSKYMRVGRASGTKIDLYKRAVEDGVLGEPGLAP